MVELTFPFSEGERDSTARRSAVVLMGPTASGKTQLALHWARRRPSHFEIVCVDAVTFYRGLDIGSAKPTPEERQEVPHHGLDILEPWERASPVVFVKQVGCWLEAIWARGRIPILVGGSCHYFKWLMEGMSATPQSHPKLRAWLEEQRHQHPQGLTHLRRLLERLDPTAAARLHPNDGQRHVRALEVVLLTGQSYLTFPPQPETSLPQQTGGHWVLWMVVPPSLQALKEPIAQRLQAMMAAGWLEEVAALYRSHQGHEGGYPALNSVGYKQMLPYLQGQCTLEAALESVRRANLALAKRQLTWMSAWPQPFHRLALGERPDDPWTSA